MPQLYNMKNIVRSYKQKSWYKSENVYRRIIVSWYRSKSTGGYSRGIDPMYYKDINSVWYKYKQTIIKYKPCLVKMGDDNGV